MPTASSTCTPFARGHSSEHYGTLRQRDHYGATVKGNTADRQQTGSARSQRYLADKIANTMTFQQTINV